MNTTTLTSVVTQGRGDAPGSFSKSNVGGYDRLLRAALGAVLLMDGMHGTGPLGLDAVLIMLSIPLIISAIIAWDPFYALFKVRTVTLPAQAMPHWKLRSLNANGGINIGTIDRLSRMVLAGVLMATPFLWAGPLEATAIAASYAGILVMMTAVMGWDPLYQFMGVRTATLPIETGPQISAQAPLATLSLFDPVQGEADDIYQKAA